MRQIQLVIIRSYDEGQLKLLQCAPDSLRQSSTISWARLKHDDLLFLLGFRFMV